MSALETSQELFNRAKVLTEEAYELRKQACKGERYEAQVEASMEAAEAVSALFNSLKKVGFSDERAYDLIKTMMTSFGGKK